MTPDTVLILYGFTYLGTCALILAAVPIAARIIEWGVRTAQWR